MNEFGERLRLLRREKGISLDEVALAIGSTKSTLSKYERGVVDPTLDVAYKIARYFLVSLDWISGYGDVSEIIKSIPSDYIKVVQKAIGQSISPDRLEKAVDLLSE